MYWRNRAKEYDVWLRQRLITLTAPWFDYRSGLHALRTTIACVIAFCITRFFDIPHSSWALVTIIVVMGPASYFRTTLSKANQRLAGTVIGALAGLSLHLIPAENTATHGTLLIGLLALTSYFFWSRYSYAAILAAVTLAIVSDVAIGDLSALEWRVFNVILGTSIIWVCSRFVFPERALNHFQVMVSEFLQLIADYYLLHLPEHHSDSSNLNLSMDVLSQNLAQQRAIAAHVKTESNGQADKISEILTLEHRIIGLVESLLTEKWPQSMPTMSDHSHQLFESMNLLSLELAGGRVSRYPHFNFLQHYQNLDLQYLNQCTYVWLNHQLSQQISRLSVALGQIYDNAD